MANTLSLYLQLEATMMALDELGQASRADALRDTMDGLWLDLSPEERTFLTRRDDLIIAPVIPRAAEPPAEFHDVWIAA